MKIHSLLICFVLAAVRAPAADNHLTPAESTAGWQLLFDGKTLAGWRPFAGRQMGGWEVVDGTLHAIAKTKGCDLITERTFKDFELAWEWKLPVGGNNGVKYFVTEQRPKSPGPEYQMIDDDSPAARQGGLIAQTAAFYEVLPPAKNKPLRSPGQWNSSRIVARGDHVEHWLNDKLVLAFKLQSQEVKAGIAKSKFKDEVGFGDHITGHILLTYHQDDCWYRNIRIRELH